MLVGFFLLTSWLRPSFPGEVFGFFTTILKIVLALVLGLIAMIFK
jgi:hypothetical protein